MCYKEKINEKTSCSTCEHHGKLKCAYPPKGECKIYKYDDDDDESLSTIEKQYVELRELAKYYVPKNIFNKIIKQHNKNRSYSL
jgi:hypothetical protein